MSEGFRVNRRRFLGGLALLGATPVYAQLEALPPFNPNKQWTGDNFEEGHDLLRNPRAVLRQAGPPTDHPDPYDVLIVGAGISGLTCAWKLRDRRVLLLERERETGGVSKSESWNGITYGIGAAYMIDPEPDEEDPDPQDVANYELLREIGLREDGEDLARERGKNRRWAGHDNHCVFTNERVLGDDEVYSHENVAFFEAVVEGDNFPSIPPSDPALVAALDRTSFHHFLLDGALQQRLYGRRVGALSPAAWEAIEYYFWGAFGTNSWETSAYHGLNFFAAEFTNILVFPGGNAYIARRLAERIGAHRPDAIQTGSYVMTVDPEPEGQGWTALVWREGRVHRFHARAVIFASPLFLAKRMVPSLPADQMRALDSLDYRSYVVANVLLRRPIGRIFENETIRAGYELTRVHETDPLRWPPEHLSARAVYSDIVNATFPIWGESDYAVLTVYRPYPYAHGRELLRYLTYDHVEEEIRRSVLEGFAHHGLRHSDIEGVRLTRWGHPMLIARPGQLADGTMALAARTRPGLFFSHTDIQGAPAIENALASAHAAVAAVSDYLR